MARILLIDDDAVFCRLLQEILEEVGYEVVVAHNGREGVACYETTSIDLVITDILMPEQEGLETITILRRSVPESGLSWPKNRPSLGRGLIRKNGR
jgi:CheY-like chemotaxis protein